MTTARSEVKGKSRVTRKLFILFNHYVRQTDLCWATVNTKTLFHLFSLLLFHDIFCFTNYLYFKAMSYSRSVCRLPSCAFVYFRLEIDSRLLGCISIYNAVADAYCLPPPQASELKIGMIRTSSSRDIRYDRAGSFYSFSAFSLGIYGHGRIGGE